MTALELLSFLEYHKSLGVLIWKDHWDKTAATKLKGLVAGSVDSEGYRVLTLEWKRYKAHRLIWFLETGEWVELIDHINGDKLDNRIENLRDVSKRKNCQNRWTHREGRLPGTTFNKRHGKWYAQIRIGTKRKHLGSFDDEIAAHQAYMKACEGVTL